MYTAYIVKRTQIYLDDWQDHRLAERANAEGSTKSSLIRRAIDEFLRGEPEAGVRLERFRTAVREASGVAPYLPEGTAYVEELRRLDAARQEASDPDPSR